jgi:FkbM family methyltransferase
MSGSSKKPVLIEITNRMRHLSRNGWVVIDIGAGLGDFAVSVAYEHPGCHVYAYEPFPESFRLLEENIILNGTRNVITIPCRRWGNIRTNDPFHHRRCGPTFNDKRFVSHVHSITVKGLSLDDVLETNAIPVCDFLKMDCEGGEFDILFSASEATLRKIRHICLEYHDGVTKFSHADLVDYLQKRGFHVRTAPNPVHNHLGFLYAFRPSGDGL